MTDEIISQNIHITLLKTLRYYKPLTVEMGSVDSLEKLNSFDTSCDPSLTFGLGVRCLELGFGRKAVDVFQSLIEDFSNQLHILNNLGVAYAWVEDYESAKEYFYKAIGMKDSELYPVFNVSHLHLAIGELCKAENMANKVNELSPQGEGIKELLGMIAEVRGDREGERRAFEEELRRFDHKHYSRERLALLAVENGVQEAKKGNWEAAFSIWRRACLDYGLMTYSSKNSRNLMAGLRLSEIEKSTLEILYNSNPRNPRDLFSHYLFLKDAHWEAWREKEEVEKGLREYDAGSVLLKYPLEFFEYALFCLFHGRYFQAWELLQEAMALIPPAKQEVLRLKEIIHFTKAISDGEKLFTGEVIGWTDHPGTKSLKDICILLGIDKEEAKEWQWGWEMLDILKIWRDTGMSSKVAESWYRSGISPADAVVFLESGISDIDEAKRWLSNFTFALSAVNWKQSGFSVEEAVYYKNSGVSTLLEAIEIRAHLHSMGKNPVMEIDNGSIEK